MKIDRHAKVAIKYLNPCAIIKIEEFNLIWKLNTTASLFDLISLNILKSLVVFSFDVSLFLHDILFFILLTNNWIFVIKQQVSNDSKMQIIQMEHILEKKSTLQRKSPVKRGPITSLYSPKPKNTFLRKHIISTKSHSQNTQINHEIAACEFQIRNARSLILNFRRKKKSLPNQNPHGPLKHYLTLVALR